MLRSGCLLLLVLGSSADAQVIRAVGAGTVLPGPIMIRSGPTAVTPVTGQFPPPIYYPGNPWYNYGYNNNRNYFRPGGFVPFYGFGGGWNEPQPTIVNTTIVNNPAPIVIVAPPARKTGRVTINVPRNAVLFVDGVKSAQSGSVRVIETPELLGEQTHILKLRLTWERDGQPQEEIREMELRVGDSRSWTILGGE